MDIAQATHCAKLTAVTLTFPKRSLNHVLELTAPVVRAALFAYTL